MVGPRRLLPEPMPRLRFREMTVDDLDDVAELLGMTHIDDDRAQPWIVRTVMGMQLEPGATP